LRSEHFLLCGKADTGKQKDVGAKKTGVCVEKVAFKNPANTEVLNAAGGVARGLYLNPPKRDLNFYISE
jgi:hypothetical protein